MANWNLIPPCEWLDTEEQVIEASTYLVNNPNKEVGFDTETTGLHYIRDFPLMFSLSDGVRRFAGMWDPWGNHYAIQNWLLENPEITIIGTGIKFDMHMVANRGITIRGDVIDTLVMDWLYDENRWNHDLKATARDHCGIKMRDFKEVFPFLPKKKDRPKDTAGAAIMRKISTPEGFEEAKEYAGLDAFASLKVRDFLRDRLKEDTLRKNYSFWQYFKDWEVDFTRVLWNMERRGFMLATGHLRAQIKPMEAEIETLKGKLAQLVGYPLNPGSTKQLKALFFDHLQRVPIKYTKGGKSGIKSPSTDAEVLETWAEDGTPDAPDGCPYAKLIMECRGVVKTKGTYIEGPLELVDDNLRIHTQLKQHGTVTGRLSSKEPNLQNLPRPKGDKYRIREAFVAPPGKVLFVSDYAQLEMRLMAHFSQDPRMLKAILDGLDLHCFTVSLMYGVEYSEVVAAKKEKGTLTDRQILLIGYRQAAKATGFGLIYGIGPKKLGADLTLELGRLIDMKEAQGMIRAYFDIFRGVEDFIKATHNNCRRTHYVQTIIGRKRRLPQITAKGSDAAKGLAAQARRQAVNSIIQGTAADIAKAAMIRCEWDAELNELDAQLLMQVHDELIFEVDNVPETMDLVEKRVTSIMETPFPGYALSVPIPTEGSFAYTWADAK